MSHRRARARDERADHKERGVGPGAVVAVLIHWQAKPCGRGQWRVNPTLDQQAWVHLSRRSDEICVGMVQLWRDAQAWLDERIGVEQGAEAHAGYLRQWHGRD